MNCSLHDLDRRTAGFSLIEMVTVLVMLGILVGIAAPSMRGMTATTKLERAREQLMGDLLYARMLAIRSGQSATLCPLPSQNGYQIRRDDTDCTSTDVVKSYNLEVEYPGIELEVENGFFRFDSRGFAVERPGSGTDPIAVTYGSRSAAFEVTAIGTMVRHD